MRPRMASFPVADGFAVPGFSFGVTTRAPGGWTAFSPDDPVRTPAVVRPSVRTNMSFAIRDLLVNMIGFTPSARAAARAALAAVPVRGRSVNAVWTVERASAAGTAALADS